MIVHDCDGKNAVVAACLHGGPGLCSSTGEVATAREVPRVVRGRGMSWGFLPGDLKEERRREEQYRRMRQLNDSCVQRRFTTSPRASLLLAVVAVGVRAAAVARVDVAGGGHVEGAVEVVAGALAVELAGAEVDVRGAVAVHPRLRLDAVGAGVAGVEGDRLEDREHCVWGGAEDWADFVLSVSILAQNTFFFFPFLCFLSR